jgi:ADP-ribosylglycohydrolase
MPGWDSLHTLLKLELTQSLEEGKDPDAIAKIRNEIESAHNDPSRLRQIHEQLLALPIRNDFPFDEPNDLPTIRALRKSHSATLKVDWDVSALEDKLYGAWLGRCCGCALGKPVECFMEPANGLSSYERTKTYLSAIAPEEWPPRDYIPAHSPAEDRTGTVGCPDSVREQIRFMESDDDIRYTVLGQILIRDKGSVFSTRDVARTWINLLPYKQVCTAETQAYRNLVNRYEFHCAVEKNGEIDWLWVATHLNPYREWIGAQIRVDSYGYAAPGNPELAAEFAWRDARLSHVKNGIYGAMFCAAMIAASFATRDVLEIVECGLAEIPATSRLYAEMRDVIVLCAQYNNDPAKFEAVFAGIQNALGHYSSVHTNNNAAVCVAALLLSQGDFSTGISLAVAGGWDTDCNGATVGSMVGAITGGRKAPTLWTGPLHDTLNSAIAGYHPIAISECARRSLAIARKIAGRESVA